MGAPPSPEPTGKGLPRKRRAWARVLDGASWVALVGFLAFVLLRDTGGPPAGAAAPSVWLAPLDGSNAQQVPQASRKPLLIKVFASWCGACRRSTWLDDLVGLNQRSQLAQLAVSVDDDLADARRAQAEWPIQGPVLLDRDQAFSRAYDVKVLPTYILVDTTGHIVRVTTGLPGPLDYKAWYDAR